MSSYLEAEVINEMRTKGFEPKEIIFDGKPHRFERNGKKDAWYMAWKKALSNSKEFCTVIYSDWHEDARHKFSFPTPSSNHEKFLFSNFIAETKIEQLEEEKLSESLAIQKTKKIWNEARPVGTNEYLQKKKIYELYGFRIHNNKTLILPIRNVWGDLKGIQSIYDDGKKRFESGQKNKGNFVLVPDNFDLKNYKDTVYVVEGFATGASIHIASGKPVVCALSANNLQDVCLNLKKFNKSLKIVVAGDDDQFKPFNTGQAKAKEAAASVGASFVFPNFSNLSNKPTDFSDLYLQDGISEVAKQLLEVEESEKKNLPPVLLANEFIMENKLNFENRLIIWKLEFYQFQKSSYSKISSHDLLNDITKFVQEHPLVWFRATKNFAKEILGNIEAKANVKTKKQMPFWLDFEDEEVKMLINAKNGFIDLQGVEKVDDIKLSKHTSNLFNTVVLPVEFNSKTSCPVWLKFMDEMVPDRETQCALQEWFGYNLVFDNSFQKFAIFFGQGANGKSVCCVVFKALLGNENISAVSLEAFDPKRTFVMAATIGKLANIVEELNINSKAEEGIIKQYVTGGRMTIERKNIDAFEVDPTARLTFATNTLPKLNDSSDGIWRRLLLFPFNNQILDPSKQNRSLTDLKFWQNSGELSGVLNWAIEGLIRLRKNGQFTISKEMADVLSKYKLESNPTKDFLAIHCEFRKGAVLSSTKLYDCYKAYMEQNNYRPFGANKFCDEVRSVFPMAKKTDNAISFPEGRCRAWYNLDLHS